MIVKKDELHSTPVWFHTNFFQSLLINHRCHVRRMLQLSPFSFWNAIHTAFNLFPAFRWWVACVPAGPRTIHIVLYPEGLERLRRRQLLGNGPRNWARRVRFGLPPTIWTPSTTYTAFKRGRGGGESYSLRWPIRSGSARKGYPFRLQVYERIGIPLVEVLERVAKSVIWVCERAQ